jgi:hypothetical protein
MPPLKVVLTGIAGVRKQEIVEEFQSYLIDRWDDLSPAQVKVAAPWICAEEDIGFEDFLEFSVDDQRTALWSKYREARKKWKAIVESPGTRLVMMTLHATFMNQDRIFSPLSWQDGSEDPKPSMLLSFLSELEPDYIVNLIDDVYYQGRVPRRFAVAFGQP